MLTPSRSRLAEHVRGLPHSRGEAAWDRKRWRADEEQAVDKLSSAPADGLTTRQRMERFQESPRAARSHGCTWLR
jgi:hypothetical protein